MTQASPNRLGSGAEIEILQRHPMITLAIAAILGTVASRFAPMTLVVSVATVAGLLGWRIAKQGRTRGWMANLAVCAAVFALAGHAAERRFNASTLTPYLSESWRPLVFDAIVSGRVELRPNHLLAAQHPDGTTRWQSVFDLEIYSIRHQITWQPVVGNVRTTVNGDCRQLLPGDHVRVRGQIQAIPPPRNPGQFDLRALYRIRHQHARVRVDHADQITQLPERSFAPDRIFASLGSRGEEILNDHLGHPSGALAAALVLGRREAVDQTIRDKLLETGTAHLLSVSGMHVGMVALMTVWIVALCGFSRSVQIFVVIAVCASYAALAGGRPPVIRATAIVAIFLLGRWFCRAVHPWNALALAALLLLILNPDDVRQIGVQLSFLAVGTLMMVNRANRSVSGKASETVDPLDRLVAKQSPIKAWLADAYARTITVFRYSLWVGMITGPLIWWQFHLISLVSCVANVVLGIPLFVALTTALATVALGWVWQPLAALPAFVCRSVLSCMLQLIEGFAAIPGGHYWMPSPPGWWVVLFYALVFAGFALPRFWPRKRLLIAWIAIWTLIAIPLSTIVRRQIVHAVPEGAMEALFIDVGHGTSVLLRHPVGGDWLYDCGRLGDPTRSSRPIQAVLWDKGIRRLNGIILSHADSDHYNGLPTLLRRFHVDKIITPPGFLTTNEPGLVSVRQAVKDASVPVVELSTGDVLTDPQGRVAWATLLHPPKKRVPGNDNVNSLVLRIVHGNQMLLLPGDLEMPGTQIMLGAKRPDPGGVLMAPHHGSLQQDVRPLLDWCRPSNVIVSGNHRAKRPAVRQSLTQTGAQLHITAIEGAIQVQIDASGNVTTTGWIDSKQ